MAVDSISHFGGNVKNIKMWDWHVGSGNIFKIVCTDEFSLLQRYSRQILSTWDMQWIFYKNAYMMIHPPIQKNATLFIHTLTLSFRELSSGGSKFWSPLWLIHTWIWGEKECKWEKIFDTFSDFAKEVVWERWGVGGWGAGIRNR